MAKLLKTKGKDNAGIYQYPTRSGIRYAVRLHNSHRQLTEGGIPSLAEALLIRDSILIDFKRQEHGLPIVKPKVELTFRQLVVRLAESDPSYLTTSIRQGYAMLEKKRMRKVHYALGSWQKSECHVDHLLRFFGPMNIATIDHQLIIRYLAIRREEPIMHSPELKTSDTTIKKEFRVAKQIFDRAYILGLVSSNIFATVLGMRLLQWRQQPRRRLGAQTYLPREVRDKIVAAAKEYDYRGHVLPRIYVPIIAETGCRPSDLSRVYWKPDTLAQCSFIDLANRVIVLRFGDHKSRAAKFQQRPRQIHLSESLCGYLRQFELKGQKLLPDSFQAGQVNTFRRLCASIGLEGISIYSLRYSAACDFCNAARDRLSEQAIADHLGHSVATLRNIYSEPSSLMADLVTRMGAANQ